MRDKIANDPTGATLNLMWRTDILPLLEEHHYGDRNVDVKARYGLEALTKSVAAKASATTAEETVGPKTTPSDDDFTATDPH